MHICINMCMHVGMHMYVYARVYAHVHAQAMHTASTSRMWSRIARSSATRLIRARRAGSCACSELSASLGSPVGVNTRGRCEGEGCAREGCEGLL